MRELVLVQPGQSIEGTVSRDAAAEAVRRELERLLAENAPLAYRVALGVLRNSAEAEDVAQEALLRAYRKFDSLREAQRFRGWLVRVSFRLALDRSRSVRRRQDRETRWAQPELRPPVQSVEEIAVGRQFEERLGHALEELPDRLRLVILLTAIEGHSMEEVAVLLEVPVGTVKSRLFTARKRLAEKLR
jgi:RNA polymerase sigma-70 factor (ECF subfamily)